MTKNKIKKQCPHCKNSECEIKGVIVLKVIVDKVKKHISLNDWKCLKCKQTFQTERKGDKKEQELVHEFIDASKIILVEDKEIMEKS